MEYPVPIESFRQSEYPIDPQFLKRWSPRAMNGAKIDLPVLMSLFEAARWAPSSSNLQPWNFIYGIRDTPAFDGLFQTLGKGNQAWCVNAGALVLAVSNTQQNGKPNKAHAFDTGSAWMSLALQGSLLNLVVHGMLGFDFIKAHETAALPIGYEPQAMIAIGHPAPVTQLPESYRDREKPSDRKKIEEFVFEGKWPG